MAETLKPPAHPYEQVGLLLFNYPSFKPRENSWQLPQGIIAMGIKANLEDPETLRDVVRDEFEEVVTENMGVGVIDLYQDGPITIYALPLKTMDEAEEFQEAMESFWGINDDELVTITKPQMETVIRALIHPELKTITFTK